MKSSCYFDSGLARGSLDNGFLEKFIFLADCWDPNSVWSKNESATLRGDPNVGGDCSEQQNHFVLV